MSRNYWYFVILVLLTGCSESGPEESLAEDSFGQDGDEFGDAFFSAEADENEGMLMKPYIPPNSPAEAQARLWQEERPEDAQVMARLAQVPVAIWLGEWSGDVRNTVERHLLAATEQEAVPVFVVYYIPDRDCSGFSAGGAVDVEDYRWWIGRVSLALQVVEDLGLPPTTFPIIILEPDALPLGEGCLTGEDREERLALMAETAEVLTRAGADVYVDIGHSNWLSVKRAAELLRAVGVENLAGFSLNVSNFRALDECTEYGEKVSGFFDGDIRFVVDTSRNGRGPDPTGEWCNPPGRALGVEPTSDTGHTLVDWFLWVKVPGESDGECNNGPPAGSWWPEYALKLARNAGW